MVKKSTLKKLLSGFDIVRISYHHLSPQFLIAKMQIVFYPLNFKELESRYLRTVI